MTAQERNARIVRVEWGRLTGQRPRKAGSNARLGEHGLQVRPPVARLTTDTGVSGFGACYMTQEQAARLLGRPLSDFFDESKGVKEEWLPFEYPLWDLMGQLRRRPVYALVAEMAGVASPESLRAPCYDTSLYFDDLHLTSEEEAAALLAEEAREGYARGHRAFKIKVGRGARHLPLEEGTRRDIAIVRAARQAVGPEPPILLDANNGYNLNLTKRVLQETADCGVFWMEEAFHEDATLYRDLREWMQREGLSVLIADGEGQASPHLLEWARNGVVDIIQYDIFSYGFTRWLALGKQLDEWGVHSAPHHYGGLYGNYVSCHLAAVLRNFTFVEWDEAVAPELDASGYAIEEGQVVVPSAPGFGLTLNEEAFQRSVQTEGFSLPGDTE